MLGTVFLAMPILHLLACIALLFTTLVRLWALVREFKKINGGDATDADHESDKE